ncbi:IPT/TIG domain-containing protein [Salinibacterium amurskyense]|uniref:IPT/TIG domain-containing protein n=1 Tax=Salinibacterium amurskyense TaxID=205941 RepID=UPI00311E1BE0
MANTVRSGIATLAAVGLVALSVFSTGTPAQAAAGDDSIAESAYLSGSLLSGLVAGELALLGESDASNDGTQALQTESSSVGALVGLTATAGGIGVPIALANAGVLSAYSQAADNGSSIAATGLVDASGDVGVDLFDISDRPSGLSLDLVAALAPSLADELTALSLEVGATSSRASQAAPAAASGTYEIVGAELKLTSDTVAGVSTTVDGLAGTLSGAVDAVAGPSGSLVGAVSSVAQSTLGGLGLVSTTGTSASVTLDLPGAIAPLYTPMTSDAVTIDFGTGEITVDLAELKGGSLSGQPANTSVLTSAELTAITASVTTLVGQFADNVEDAVTAALDAAEVDIEVTLGVNLGLGVIPLASVTVEGTLAELASSSGTIGITALGALNVSALTTAIVGGVVAPLVSDLLDPSTAALQTFVAGLQTGVVTPVIDALSPVFTALESVLAITINNQELIGTAPDQQFVETALRVGLLAQGPVAGLLELDIARSAVGPNHAGVRPAITDIDPGSGPATGGTAVTITGTDFGGSTGVTFDGVAATDFVVVSDTEITVTSPAHAAGAVDVIIQHPAGASDAAEFTYTPVPLISALTPDFGPVAGGTVVTITGSEFTDATGVTFDGTDGTSFTVDSDTQITVTSPAHALGAVDLIIERATGDSAPSTFTYRGAPTVSDLTPTEGPVAGGTEVTITGTGFTGSTGVTFDGDAGTAFTVVSDTEITVSSPAHAAGDVTVVVQHPIGNASAGDFTYSAAPVISSLSPNIGPVAGGTVVTITGTGFTGATGVTFDGDAGTSFSVVSDAEITVSTPAHSVGVVDVIVQNTPSDSAPGEFSYQDAPTVSSIAPDEGPLAGGTEVTITGTGFSGATGVTFDGDDGTSFTVVSDTEITVTTPAGSEGAAAVVVEHPAGDVSAGDFTYVAAPTVSAMSPDLGPIAGGTEVTITGTGFTGATGVTFDGDDGTSFTVVSDTEITVSSPAHSAGDVAVVVEHVGGDATAGDFTYLATPNVTNVTPTSGPLAGGTEVTITGTGFTGATGVTFDGDDGTSFTVVSDTEITVTTPAHAAGDAPIVVEHPISDAAAGDFTYTAAPAISSLAPDSGPEAGGTEVTITGTGFTGATGVTFDGDDGTSFTVVSDTEITVTSPAHAAGDVDVVVTHASGDSVPVDFTYLAPPTVTSIAPDEGPLAGGTEVTITGTGFTGATGVTFDGDDGTSFTVVSDTEITVTTPAGSAGAAAVVVEHAAGDAEAGDFTYVAAPTVSDLTPVIGPIAGGSAVTITGSGFTGATGVTFDGDAGTSFTVVSDTEITVSSPAHAAGEVEVVVEHAGGDVTAGNFTYLADPVVTDVTPTSGPLAGGTEVTITGSGFTGATGVTFDGDDGTSFTVVSDTEITVTTPAHAAGDAPIVVVHPVVNAAAGDFTYTEAPAIASLAPNTGPVAGGTVVTITGTGFTGATGVTFDGDDGTSFTVVSDTEITVTSPAHAAGGVDVVVTHASGDSAPADFAYLDPPAVTSISPDEGPLSGGTDVTIIGTGFTGATGVTFDGDEGTSFTVVSDTEITVTTPAGAEGAATVVVEHPNGDADGGDFTYLAAPVITDISPVAGPTSGGTSVTLTGTGFTGATGVTFDGDDGTSFTVVSDTEITVTSPAHAVGAVEVTVAHPGGASNPATFTYRADPTVSDVAPNVGPLEGGTEVTITGTGFTGATGVTFDGDAGTSFTVVSDTEITVTTPPNAAGAAAIVIQHPIADTSAGDFTYAASGIPIVSSMSPLVGPDSGGTLVTLRGSGFLGATGARFGVVWGTNFTVVSDTMATVLTPEHDAMWVPAVLASGATMAGTPGFTFQPSAVAGADDGLAFTGSSSFQGAWLALALMGAGALLLFSRRPVGRHRA